MKSGTRKPALSSTRLQDQRCAWRRLRISVTRTMMNAMVGMSQVLRNASPPRISPNATRVNGRSNQTTTSSGPSERSSAKATPMASRTNGMDMTCGWRSPRRKLKKGNSWMPKVPGTTSMTRVARHQNQNWSGNQRALSDLTSSLMPIQLQNPLEPNPWAANASSRPSRWPMIVSRRAPTSPKTIGRQSIRFENPAAGVPGPLAIARSSRGAARL